MKKVVVGLSGGVDSSVAAFLLKEQGYDVLGVTMLMWAPDGKEPQSVTDARKVAEHLDIPYYVLDFTAQFKKEVVDYFTEEYLAGRTPNPCNMCNRRIKWEALLSWAHEQGAEYIATGHYARIDLLENGRYAIRNSVTAQKDQTYALCNLTQEQLKHTLLPVGEYTKDEIRRIAAEQGLPVAHKSDSQDICFIPDGDYGAFLEQQIPDRIPGEGNFVLKDGTVIGRHKGVTHYTIGQRKGLGIAMGHPVFVCEIRPETNEVVIGENEDIFSCDLICSNVNYMGMEEGKEPERCVAKVRYAHKGDRCELRKLPDGRMQVRFDKTVRAITPGQSVVFYDGEYVLGGGVIEGNMYSATELLKDIEKE
ncbi:MAG: tRNA 2-thiouridine(34) synthase MnmA [Lachnospiraceae bacterium]|nr:tRNA 2-thiouridine(34) synthase MnmA [Lachnospiraceae bacterium]